MKLIDADKLREAVEFHVTSVSVCGTVAEARGMTQFKEICLEDIDNAPTIDAIPVEWLEAHDSEGNEFGRRYITVVEALSMWEKEQEAR